MNIWLSLIVLTIVAVCSAFAYTAGWMRGHREGVCIERNRYLAFLRAERKAGCWLGRVER